MKNFHQRVFVLNFFEDDIPEFKSDSELKAFHEMLGRTLMYGLRNPQSEDVISLVTSSLRNKGTEVVTCYYPNLPSQDKWPDGSSKYLGSAGAVVENTIKHLQDKSKSSPFVIGAINRGDSWSYHS